MAARRLNLERLEPRLALTVVINEFVAENDNGLTDFEGQYEDWLELRNTGGSAVDVAGWYLTDDALDLTKWQIPSHSSTLLDPGEYLTIFASNKDGIFSGELHTNFELNNVGEYLALVQPNGTTVEYDFGAAFPEQFADVSYGNGASTSATSNVTLVGASTSLRVISPTAEDAARDDNWREIGYDDSSWLSGTRSVGFDRNSPTAPDLTPFIGRTLTVAEMDSTDATPQYSAYVRYAFNVTDKDQLTSLQLDLRFDDGFIGYLNGREVRRVNFAEDFVYTQPQWNSYAGNQAGTSSTAGAANRVDESDDVVTFDLTPFLPELVNGTNVLAFHGVNSNSTSGSSTNKLDFLVEPVLTAVRATGAEVAGTYMVAPTPGGDNGIGTLGLVADTSFSVDRGFYDTAQSVEITTTTAGATIRYTTDGSVPTLTNGTTYAGPLNINTTTILRAAAFKTGWTPSDVDTQTYIFLVDVIGQSAADVTEAYATWGHDKEDGDTTSGYNLDDESDWAMDPDIRTAVGDAQLISDLKSIPSMSVVMDWDDLFSGTPQPGTFAGTTTVAPNPQGIYIHGRGDERYMSLEYVNPDVPTDQFQIDGAIEIQGHSSPGRWNSDKLSFQVKFKDPYGPAKLNYPLFDGVPDGQNATTQFDTLILDAMYNYAWIHANTSVQANFARYVTDQVVSDLQNLASGGGQAPHGKYVHLYLNGLYWGLYNVHERPDDSFSAQYYDGNKSEYYAIKHANSDVNHEYTWVEGGIAAEQAYNTLLLAARAVETTPSSLPTYQTVESLLDIDQYIDYMIVHYYAGGGNDWAHNNWYATYNHVDPNGKWRFHAWDQEHAIPTNDNGDSWDQNSDLTTKDDLEAPTEIHRNLINNAEYRLRFADRVQALMYNGGVLTEAAAAAVYQGRLDEIDRAIVGESARWGDNRFPTDPYTRQDWLETNSLSTGPTDRAVIVDFFPARTGVTLTDFDGAGWIPTLDAPLFSQYGGEISTGFQLTLTKPGGSPGGATIYYTTDGSDPRLEGGGLSGSAILYSGPITLNAATQVKARIYFDNAGTSNDWSPIEDRTFVLDQPYPVRIVEVHYHPANYPGVVDDEDLEFLELLNAGSSTVSLEGVQITQFAGTPYVFGSGISLDAGERIVVARDPAVFETIYGTGINLAAAGYDPANLSNGGEPIGLLGPVGELVQLFSYDDIAPWPTSPDGLGPSLEYIGPFDAGEDPNDLSPADPFDDPANWRASYDDGGSPGTDGELPPLPGDYDLSNTVDEADFTKWRSQYGMSFTPGTESDGNGDGIVNGADYTVWRDNLGATQPGSGSGSGSGSFVASTSDDEMPPVEVASVQAESPIAVAEPTATVAHVASASVELPVPAQLSSFAGGVVDAGIVPAVKDRLGHRRDSSDGQTDHSANLLLRDSLLKASRARANVDAVFDTVTSWPRRHRDGDSQDDEVLAKHLGPASQSEDQSCASVWEDEGWLQQLSSRRVG